MSGKRCNKEGFIKRALVTSFFFIIIFTVIVYGALQYQAARQVSDLKVSEQAKVKLTSGLLEQIFGYTINDLFTIANHPSTERFNRERAKADEELLQKIFRAQLEHKPAYNQLRFLDSEGYELIRLDNLFGRTLTKSDGALQFKGNRYYFVETLALSEGEVYVSPLDLNVENGKIDIPYLPVIRFGVRVSDEETGNQGVLILNMKGESLLETFSSSMGTTYPAFLLNDEGGVLFGPNKNDEWGFVFNLPSAFESSYPVALKKILDNDSGVVETPDGLFIFEAVHPLKPFNTDSRAEQYAWKAISFVPSKALPSSKLFNHPWVLTFYVSGVFLIVIVSFYLQFLLFKRRELRRENEHKSKRFWEISSALGIGLIVMDSDGLITYMNPEAERILGWDFNELVAKKGHQIFHVHDGDESTCSILNVMGSQQHYRSKDEEFRRKDNVIIPVILDAAPLTRDTGEEGVVISFLDFSEIKTYQEKIQALAYQDILTALPNRRALDERLQVAIELSERHGRYFGLMFLDLDQFKAVNDTYGHDAGDILLKEVSTRLKHIVRKSDTVARMGGDEFIVLLPEISSVENPKAIAEKIIQSLAEPIILPQGEARVGVSIGIVVACGAGLSGEELIQSADEAMYEAKRRGRNQFFIRDTALPAEHASG
ncbi:diguanylate cyclase domain-containing protein [Marinobacter sp.]|uniref:diguanylate cyclase domain-containing protein n=1 Tax=Marinobacter sp. TaxID=50741 RepID=UPI0035656306